MSALSEVSRCVYCGFCEPLCPTLTPGGNRAHGPRGRINIIVDLIDKRLSATKVAKEALFTCLLCDACSLVCPAKIRIADAIREARAALVHP